jgi:hypothetical protein
VTSNRAGTRIVLDDRDAGIAGDHPLVVDKVAPGVHDMRAERTGFKTWMGRIRVRSGEVTQLGIRLDPEDEGEKPGLPPAGPAPAERPGHASRVAFWSTLGASAAMGAGMLVSGLRVLSLQDDKDRSVKEWAQTHADYQDCTPTHPCSNICDRARAAGDAKTIDACNDGDHAALAFDIFLGVGVAALAASTYFYYKGYVEPNGSDKPGTPAAAGPHLRAIGPEIFTGSRQGAGITAEFEF